MALNATTLGTLIKTNLLADPNSAAQNNAALTALCTAIASAVITHITTSGIVIGTATGALGGGPGVPIVGTVT